MNSDTQRYHPASILVELATLAKNSIAFYLFLFVFKATSTATWVIWGRYILLGITIWSIISIFLKWMYRRYEIVEGAIVVSDGIFVKKQQRLAFNRIQNHVSKTNMIHRLFGLTSITLETDTKDHEVSFYFPVITKEEKNRLIEQIEGGTHKESERKNIDATNQTIHFQSTKKDMIKASFSSLSFLAIFPLLSALYVNLADYFHIEESAKHTLDYLLLHWWMLIILLLVALMISFGIGLIKTFIKYGNYRISDDKERIYIEKGMGNFVRFSIPKHRVQAVIIEQSIIKRLLGLASVKLLSAGRSEGEEETNSLYPFLPKKKAYQILQDILPDYHVEEKMRRFPIKVLGLKLIQPYYLTILTFIGFFVFKKEWLWITAIIFGLSILSRTLDYWFTSYILHENTVQIRKGGFSNETFVTHRKRIQQITVQHSWLQRQFGVTTIQFTNKAKPLHESELYGVSKEEAGTFYRWYMESDDRKKRQISQRLQMGDLPKSPE